TWPALGRSALDADARGGGVRVRATGRRRLMSTQETDSNQDETRGRGAWSALPFAFGLRRALAKGYGLAELRADVLAGMVVGVVALPLSMALGIAVGVPPQHGLYTALVAGAAVAL